MKNILRSAILIVVSAGMLPQRTAAEPMAYERAADERIIRISASAFEFTPSEIVVEKGVPVTLELVSKDRNHGFRLPRFHQRAEINPGNVQRVRFIPDQLGIFTFFCDVFCGEGHESMSGTLKVVAHLHD